MSVLRALYETYNYALDGNLVDRVEDIGEQTILLPLYHSNKKSNGKDIIQITITTEGEFIKADWVPKDEYVIYPVTESSIIRSSGSAPHPLCDELSYLSKEIDTEKHDKYIKEIKLWKEFINQGNDNSTFNAIYSYIIKETILDDVVKEIFGITKYNIDEKKVIHYVDVNQNKQEWKPAKIFITFLIENQDAFHKNLTVTTDKQLHNNYIAYVRSQNMHKPKKYCNIANDFTYCVKLHPGLFVREKIISISNNKETYYGRFKTGDEIINIGYETSQKIHLMLKYFLTNKNNSKKIGDDIYLVNWLSDDISNSSNIQLTGELELRYDDLDLIYEVDDVINLGENISKNLNDYITGRERNIPKDSKFYIMIIEIINEGRASVKYFREIFKSDLYKRIEAWYHSIKWGYYDPNNQIFLQKSPSIYSLADFIFGNEIENRDGIKIKCNSAKLRTKTIERLIPCIIDGKKIPLDLVKKMFNNLCKRNSYGKTWSSVVSIGCSILKKYILDYNLKEEVNQMLDESNKDRSYLYGRLLAIYEKLEADTLDSISNESGNRSTNAERLWTSYTKTPARTLMILEDKVRPYKERLKKSKTKSYIYYERLIGKIIDDLSEAKNYNIEKNNPLNEDFIFGYYAQKQELYKKKSEDVEDKVVENIKEVY